MNALSTATGNVQPVDTANTVIQRPFTPTKTGICTVITQHVMAAEASWMGMVMPDGVTTFSAATLVLSAGTPNPALIPTAQPPIPTIQPHSIKWHPSADPAGFRSTQPLNPTHGVMARGRLFLLQSMSAQDPVNVADQLPKVHLTLSAEVSAPDAGTGKKQLPL